MIQEQYGTGADSAPRLTDNIPQGHSRAGAPAVSRSAVRPSLVKQPTQANAPEAAASSEQTPTTTPTEGFWYNLKFALLPSFRAAEQQRLAQIENDRLRHLELLESDRVEYHNSLRKAIWREGQRQTFTTTVSQVKGGVGKTTTTCNLGSTLGSASTRTTTIIDNNEMWGTSGRLLGIPENATLTVRTTHSKNSRGEFTDFRAFSGQLGSTVHSVQLVAADAVAQRDDLYGYETAKEVIELVQHNSIFVVNDTGNHIGGNAMKAALEKTDVLVVPTITTGNSLEGAKVTMQNYQDWGYSDLVKHAIVVVSGLQPGESAEDYREVLGLPEQQILLGVPYDDRIHRDVVIDIEQTPLFTAIAYEELALATIAVHKHITQHGWESAPLSLVQGKLVKLSSGRTPTLPYIPND